MKAKQQLIFFIILSILFTLSGCTTLGSKGDKLTTNSISLAPISAKSTQEKQLPSYNSLETNISSEVKSDLITVASDKISKQTKNDKEKKTKKKIVVIDAGHQSKGNYEKEPIGPGATTMKAKVSSGTQGIYTKVPEYKLNLVIAKKVKSELEDRGYEVIMIRTTHKVNLSNKERAEIANESGADIFIRIHADGSENPEVNGVSTLYPSKKNPYVANLSADSYALSDAMVDGICKQTKAKNRGAIARDDMSGINWCKIPVSIIEMGYMSNKKEDKLMQTAKYQNKIVQGICNGIDEYFNK